MKCLTVFAAAMASPLLLAHPAAAQEGPSDRFNTVIIYGDDACPESTDDTITVCARMDEGERYRIPPNLRESNNPSNNSWTDRVRSFEQVGKFGQQSCTAVGAGGDLGCTMEMIEAAYAEKENGQDVRFSQLIDEARQERLSTIDADAAATQRRVEMIEREYMDRLDAERGAPLPGEDEGDEALPQVVDPADIPQRPANPPQ